MTNKAIGNRLRAYYESNGMTQPEVAVKFGCNQGQINRIYSGQFTARSEVAKRLCDDANVSLELNLDQNALKGVYDEIHRLWDGSPEGAVKLKKTLSSIRLLSKHTASS